jgi:ABC-type sugar transport system permease subunit
VLLYAGLLEIPEDVLEAARIDAAAIATLLSLLCLVATSSSCLDPS